MRRPRVVIIGAGFGGLEAARSLRNCDVDITLIDRRNFHLFHCYIKWPLRHYPRETSPGPPDQYFDTIRI